MSTRRSKKQTYTKQATPILLSEVKSTSTCSTLGLPLMLACAECENDLNPLINSRKKKKN